MTFIHKFSIRAGVLNLALFISLVVAIVLSSMLMLEYFNERLDTDTRMTLTLQRNIMSAVAWLGEESNAQKLLDEQTLAIDLFDDGEDSVTLHTTSWGVYQIVSITASRNNRKYTTYALFGSRPSQVHDYALVLGNSRYHLQLIGDTKIIGDVQVPDAFVTRGSFNGKSFDDPILIHGVISESPASMPRIRDNLLAEALESYFENDSISTQAGQSSPMKFTTQFSESEIILSGPATLSVIRSESKITVTRESELLTALLIAPEIVIEDSVKGSLQAFATRSIEVRAGVQLEYPSALCVFSAETSSITVGASTISGSVISQGNPKTSSIQLHAQSVVRGEIFCNNFMEFYGKVEGNMVCSRIRFAFGGEVRDNTLIDASIDRYALHKNFAFGFLYPQSSGFELIKWI